MGAHWTTIQRERSRRGGMATALPIVSERNAATEEEIRAQYHTDCPGSSIPGVIVWPYS